MDKKTNPFETVSEKFSRQIMSVGKKNKSVGLHWFFEKTRTLLYSQNIDYEKGVCRSFLQYLETLPEFSSHERVERWIDKHSCYFFQTMEDTEEYESDNNITEQEIFGRKLYGTCKIENNFLTRGLIMVRGSEGGNFSSSSYEELLTESNFSCHWQNCNTIEDSVDALFIHILQAHIPTQEVESAFFASSSISRCKWKGCGQDGSSPLLRTHYELLVHTRIHCQRLKDMEHQMINQYLPKPKRKSRFISFPSLCGTTDI